MVVWFGEENDAQRIVKIQWLKTHFNEKNLEKPIHQLVADSLADNRGAMDKLKGTQEKLIISGHGNPQAFMNNTAKQLFDTMVSKGLNNKRFESIYLLGCNIGHAMQDNSVHQNVLKEFGRLVKTGGSNLTGIKVYGPRGFITWDIEDTNHGAYITHRVRGVKIEVDNQLVGGQVIERYEFDAGLLRFEQ